MKKICFVTGARAEYGLIRPVIEGVKDSILFDYQIIAMGMHLSPIYGFTLKDILNDGFSVDKCIESLLSSDTKLGMAKSFGIGCMGISEALNELMPDMVVLLGDRYETLMAACVANILRIPIAHIHGGELTYGAIDESFRHSITKLSTLHFASTDVYRKRIIQMGEQPSSVYNVGAVGLENIRTLNLLEKDRIREVLGLSKDNPIFLVTYHPETLKGQDTIHDVNILLEALNEYETKVDIVFTGSNCDVCGIEINRIIKEYVKHTNSTFYYESLGTLRYLSLLKVSTLLIGNSSSGILEAPFLNVPTLNIGDRQKGRVRPDSVIDCSADIECIRKVIKDVCCSNDKYCTNCFNPYDKGDSTQLIIKGITRYFGEEKNKRLYKDFYDIKFD